ncbi:MAG: dihydroorotate dehydrogenase [Treponema sp.]|jgi:dihydroorotate dehydrogenase (NAD+) catalytic subunit|nr:dihydroorotate dehydrogenase [Treponema sp.]
MKELTDCNGIPYPIYAIGTVTMCGTVEGANPQGSVYMLKVEVTEENAQLPLAGQFYMLRAMKTGILLGRPISIFHAEKTPHGVELQFLILVKGKGTQELCALEADDKIQLLGPLGNTFAKPEATDKVCIVGGGIGVAPVAGFSENLNPNTYDFYACFKSGSYGLENVKAKNLIITTDDGSVGTKGMVSAVLTAQKLKDEGYSVVYACGPTPMLAYIKAICQEANVKCWISMEARMACGMGVCLGCTIPTTEGYKRCCKDGPIFDGTILEFLKPVATVKRPPLTEEPDLSVEIAGVKFKNPLIGSSGTFGFGTEYAPLFDVNKLGGISSKGLTLEPRQGNSGIRLWETPSGLMNSIGLQNPGIPHFIEHELPEMMALDAVTIANLSGSTLESYVEGAKLLDKTDVPVIELNISCPNVAAGGAAFGMSCAAAHTATKAVREVTKKPLLVKLTPQSPELIDVALSCIKAGADGISLCNSFQGVAIDIETGRPVFDKIKAGFGGPAVRPIAVRLVYELVQAINQLPENERVPVVAIGGVAGWQDVVEFIMAGATAVQVGTNTFANPMTMLECIEGLAEFMKRKGYKNIQEMKGIAQ